MRTSVSFFNLLEETVRLITQSKPLCLMTLPFGVVLFLSIKGSGWLAPLVPRELTTPEALLTSFFEHQETFILIILILILLGALRAALRGPLFLMIEGALLNKLPAPSPFPLPNTHALLRGAIYALFFEALYWIALISLGLILFSPLLLASKFNPTAIPALFQMGLLLLLVMALLFFYMKEFSLLYALLAHAKPRLALELGLKLFKKHTLLSLLFGLFLIALSFLFTFFLNLAIITSALIPFAWLHESLSTISGIIILGLTAIITETLRLLFFHALAATPRMKIGGAKKILEEEKSASGAPTV